MRSCIVSMIACCAVLSSGCGEERPSSDTAAAAAPAGYISGKVTMSDGKPIGAEVKDIAMIISGVSEAAEKVSYTPAVKPDGTYRQKVAPGQYVFNPATVTVLYNNAEFRLPLEPVGPNWNKNRDAAEGITQDFVWKPAGPTPYGQSSGLDIGNATHWYGLSVGIRFDGYRDDTRTVPPIIPDDSKLTFTLKPNGRRSTAARPSR